MAVLFYVLRGYGDLWRRAGLEEDITQMRPGRCVCISPQVCFQYRSGDQPLVFLVSTAPKWRQEWWFDAPAGYWQQPDATRPSVELERTALVAPKDLPFAAEYLAPDGSEIRQLLETPAGGLAHCRLEAGRTTQAVRHRSVSEIWFVLSGTGRLWRRVEEDDAETVLKPGRCVTIPIGADFQFRAGTDAPLELMMGTYPRWPGAQEAHPVPGRWDADVVTSSL
jgi:mannose-6-phosphate isomerase-like protein (cupin superfamily)